MLPKFPNGMIELCERSDGNVILVKEEKIFGMLYMYKPESGNYYRLAIEGTDEHPEISYEDGIALLHRNFKKTKAEKKQ